MIDGKQYGSLTTIKKSDAAVTGDWTIRGVFKKQ
jgi:hypothetical protein